MDYKSFCNKELKGFFDRFPANLNLKIINRVKFIYICNHLLSDKASFYSKKPFINAFSKMSKHNDIVIQNFEQAKAITITEIFRLLLHLK